MAAKQKPDPKHNVLRENGTANPHAEDVHDPAFSGSDFFDPRDLVQVKYEMLRRVRTEARSVTDAVQSFGVSRPTFYKVQSDFDRAGLVGLLPGKRGPHGAHKITDEVVRFIEELRSTEQSVDVLVIVDRIKQRFGLTVHRRTVERALARWKKKRP
jgi:transposase